MSDPPTPPRNPAAASPAATAAPAPANTAQAKIRAALENEGLREALRELEAARAEPEPPAPDPIIVLPEKGGEVIVADVEAAAAYVQPTARRAGPVPQDTLTRVRLDARVDPRRQPTERRLRSEVLPAALLDVTAHETSAAVEQGPAASPWTQEVRAAVIDAAALPSSHAPSSRPPPSVTEKPASARSGRSGGGMSRGVVWAALALVGTAALVVFLAVRPSGRTSGETAGRSTGTPALPSSSFHATGAAPSPTASDTEIEAIGTGATTSGAATGAAASTSAAVPTGAPSVTGAAPLATGSRPAPKRPDDVYVDAAPPPKSVPTVPSSAPTAVPSAASTTGTAQSPPYEEP